MNALVAPQQDEPLISCSFCSRNQRQVEAIIASVHAPLAYICNRCVTICVEILQHQYPDLLRISFDPDPDSEAE